MSQGVVKQWSLGLLWIPPYLTSEKHLLSTYRISDSMLTLVVAQMSKHRLMGNYITHLLDDLIFRWDTRKSVTLCQIQRNHIHAINNFYLKYTFINLCLYPHGWVNFSLGWNFPSWAASYSLSLALVTDPHVCNSKLVGWALWLPLYFPDLLQRWGRVTDGVPFRNECNCFCTIFGHFKRYVFVRLSQRVLYWNGCVIVSAPVRATLTIATNRPQNMVTQHNKDCFLFIGQRRKFCPQGLCSI